MNDKNTWRKGRLRGFWRRRTRKDKLDNQIILVSSQSSGLRLN